MRKAKGVLKVRTKPGRIVRGETRTRVKIKASALGISKVTGKVKVKVDGKTYKVKLKKGKAFMPPRPVRQDRQEEDRGVLPGQPQDPRHQQVIKIKVKRN